jgi:hypothetical protein
MWDAVESIACLSFSVGKDGHEREDVLEVGLPL